MPGEDESTPIKLVPVTADGSDFDMASLPRGLTTDEVEFLGYPRPADEDLHYNVPRENCEDWVEISDPEWMQLIRKADTRSEEHTSELQSLMRISYAVFCLKKRKQHNNPNTTTTTTAHK